MLYLIALIINIAISQTWAPFHNEELFKYKDIEVHYALIDSRVQNDDTNIQRQPLTHEIIGYLPYWQYDVYPDLDYTLLTQINYFSAELNQYLFRDKWYRCCQSSLLAVHHIDRVFQ